EKLPFPCLRLAAVRRTAGGPSTISSRLSVYALLLQKTRASMVVAQRHTRQRHPQGPRRQKAVSLKPLPIALCNECRGRPPGVAPAAPRLSAAAPGSLCASRKRVGAAAARLPAESILGGVK